MNVLIACEESQRVCIAFREKGHNAFSCDIVECSGGHPEWHIKGDVLDHLEGGFTQSGFQKCFITQNGETHILPEKWDLIIAHPPCTYITAAGACRMYPQKGELDVDRLLKAVDAMHFFYKILLCNCEKICIENPRPLKVVKLIEETQRIQPYMWRDVADENYTKLTYLWLKGLPPLVPKFNEKNDDTMPYVNAGCKRADGTYRKKQGVSFSAKQRSKTFLGIAKAMAEQWG